MNVTRLETDDVVTQLETFVMMVPNIAMRGAVSMAGEGFALESPTGPLGPICPPQGVGPGKGLSFCLMKLGPSPDQCPRSPRHQWQSCPTMTAAPITSAGRFSPLGPRGIIHQGLGQIPQPYRCGYRQ